MSRIFAKDESECCGLGANGDVECDRRARLGAGPRRRERLGIGFSGTATD
jgi:hypothetical protein